MGLRTRLDWLWPAAPERVEAKASIAPGGAGWLQMLLGYGSSKAGQDITIQTAMECTAWLCGARVISEGLAQVPCRLTQHLKDGSRRLAKEHPLYEILYRKPNFWQTSFEFREQIALHLIFTNNAYVLVTRNDKGEVLELLPFEPGTVSVTHNSDMTISYRVSLVDGRSIAVPMSDMWHIRGPSWNGWLGLNAVHLARNALGLSIAAEEFGSELFANGARPSGLLVNESSEDLSVDQVTQLREQFESLHTGRGQRMRTAVLSGVKWEPISATADEAQFIELRKFQITEVARSLRLNPIMLMHQDGTTAYASVEQMFLAHDTHSMGPWYERIEQSAECNLLTPAERRDGYEIELVSTGLVRGTSKERAETNQILAQNGVISINEWRDEDDYGRLSGAQYDRPRRAANLYGPDPTEEPS